MRIAKRTLQICGIMMKYITVLVSLLGFVSISAATEWVTLTKSPEVYSVEVVESDGEKTVLKYTVNRYGFDEVNIGGKVYALMRKPSRESLIEEKGYPRLPRINRSLLIPDDGLMGYSVINADYIEVADINVAPSKGHLLRSIDPNTVPYTFADVYQRDEFIPAELVHLRKPFILRDFRGAVVELNAFQYNPVKRVLRIYTDVTIEVKKSSTGGENVLTRRRPLEHLDPQFDTIYKRRFINYPNLDYPTLLESGGMLIICYDEFMGEMQPFIDWKIQRGIPVEIVPVSTVGTTPDQIKSFIQNQYHSTDLCYVLLVGDAAQVPSYSAQSDSDPIYSLLVGNDSYPEIFIGRFSAETPQEVFTQVERTVNYERYPDPALEWYHKGFVIGSTSGPFPEHYGEYDYTHMTKIAYKLLNHTYTQVDSAYDPWCTMPMAIEYINDGRSILFYAGHGGPEGWGTTGISTFEVNELVNSNMLPHINSVACNTGEFFTYTCLGEAFLRATHETTGEPTGGIGFYGSVQGMTGAPPLDMQDESIDLLIADSMLTLGGICFNGSMKMIDLYGGTGEWEFANLTIFGDPSVNLRGGAPYNPLVSHNPEILVGASTFSVTVIGPYGPIKRALVCAMNDEVYTTAVTNDFGQATLVFNPAIANPGTLTLTISGGDMIPYIVNLDIVQPSGAYVIYEGYSVQDDLVGNGNGQLEFYETIELGLTLANHGVSNATEVSAQLSTENPLITISRDSSWFGDIPSDSTLTINRAFELSVDPQIQDGDPVAFQLTASDGINTWLSAFAVIAHAPDIVFSDLVINDSTGGNGDSLLAPGETADLIVTLGNAGSYLGENIEVLLTCENLQVMVNSGVIACGNIEPGDEFRVAFNVTVDPNFYPPGSFPDFTINISGDHGYSDETSFNTTIGDAIYLPTGPDNYGYLAYDRYDAPFNVQYDWIELVPDSGGVGHRVPFTQLDEVYHMALPFIFQYYGVVHDTLTITTKGHICMGVTNELDYTYSSIPNLDGPPAMICPIWGDLDPVGVTVGGDAGGVWHHYDIQSHYLVIQYNYVPWYAQAYDGHATFEIILYDPEYYPTSTGDGQIKFQFKEFESWGPTGIENHTENDGLMYRDGDIYPATAAHLEDRSAVLFTTPVTMPDLSITLIPEQTPIVIPAAGGRFDYNIEVSNNDTTQVAADVWCMVTLPNGSNYGPVLGPVEILMPVGFNNNRDRTQTVPGSAPPGNYVYHGYIGDYPGAFWDEDSFPFTKSAVGDGTWYDEWLNTGESFDEWMAGFNQPAAPDVFALHPNYPNPFNPRTTIRFQLPAYGHIQLEIFDTAGRLVTTLVNGWRQAGSHQVTWDASDLPSGLYFCRMQAGDWQGTGKMVLMK